MFLQVGIDNVEYFKDEEGVFVCLTDIAFKIVESKKPMDYIYRVKDSKKRKIDNKWFITLERTKELLEKAKKGKTRPLYAQLCNLKLEESNSVIVTQIKMDKDQEECKDVESLPKMKDTTESFPEELKDSFLDIKNNYFKYKGKDVFILVVDNVTWFKGKDVAILLNLKDTDHAVNHSVDNNDKVEFKSIPGLNPGMINEKLHPKTIFINLEGMYDLIMSSRKPESKVFRRWLSHVVLPALNKFGSYSLGKKYGSFYDTEDLFEYQNQNVFYVAHIGVHNNEPLFKFGISFDYYRREFKEHRKTFDTFDLLFLRRTDNNRQVEELFKKECQSKGLYRKLDINGKQYEEIFTINETCHFDRMRVILEKMIEQHPTKEIQVRDEKIKELEHKNEILENRVSDLQDHNQDLQLMTKELRQDKIFLQKDKDEMKQDKTFLQNMFDRLKFFNGK